MLKGGVVVKYFVFWSLLVFSPGIVTPHSVFAAPPAAARVVYQTLPKPGEKVSINADYYFTYGFNKQPKLGKAYKSVC